MDGEINATSKARYWRYRANELRVMCDDTNRDDWCLMLESIACDLDAIATRIERGELDNL